MIAAFEPPVLPGLQGRRVLELGGYLAAPFATSLLAGAGAEVIKVENLTGDPFRADEKNFVAANCSKKSVAVDLKSPAGRAVFHRLLGTADIVIQNLTSAGAQRLGVTYEHCRKVKPDIVYGDISGFGPGPYESRPATNPIIEALTGVMSRPGGDARPQRQALPVYDQMAGALIAFSVAMALSGDPRGRRYFEVGLYETGLYQLNARLRELQLSSTGTPGDIMATAPYDAFRTADDLWVYLAVVSDGVWVRFCETLDLSELAGDPRMANAQLRGQHKHAVNMSVQDVLSRYARDELLGKLSAAGVPCAPIYSYSEVLRDPHVVGGDKLAPVDFRGREVRLARFPIRGEGIERRTSQRPPELGEHTGDVLAAIGYSEQELDRLTAEGAVKAAVPVGAGSEGGGR